MGDELKPWDAPPKVTIRRGSDGRSVSATLTATKSYADGTHTVALACRRHVKDDDLVVLHQAEDEDQECWFCTTDEWRNQADKTLMRAWELLQTHHDVPLESRARLAVMLIDKYSEACALDGECVPEETYAADMKRAKRLR